MALPELIFKLDGWDEKGNELTFDVSAGQPEQNESIVLHIRLDDMDIGVLWEDLYFACQQLRECTALLLKAEIDAATTSEG